jgi:hypothetical protein
MRVLLHALDRLFASRQPSLQLMVDSGIGVIASDRASAADRLARFLFAALLAVPLLCSLFFLREDRVGVYWLYVIAGIFWLVLTQIPGRERRSAEAAGAGRRHMSQSEVRARQAYFVIPLMLGLTAGWWNGALPDALRAVAWGILMPGGLLEVVSTVLTIPICLFRGAPVYRE